MRRVLLWLPVLPVVAACTVGANPVVRTSTSVGSSVSSRSPSGPPRQWWSGAIRSSSEHRLYVGGTCTSDWVTRLAFRVETDGVVRGRGRAQLASHGDPCPFPLAQLQIRAFTLDVLGNLGAAGDLALRLREIAHTPSTGADDYGGFRTTTLGTTLRLQAGDGRILKRFVLRAPDQDRGEFSSRNVVRLRCRNCEGIPTPRSRSTTS